jgi:hypothetical protein
MAYLFKANSNHSLGELAKLRKTTISFVTSVRLSVRPYVILIAFLLPLWLHESAPMLHYTYIACFVYFGFQWLPGSVKAKGYGKLMLHRTDSDAYSTAYVIEEDLRYKNWQPDNIDKPTRCNINGLLIIPISSTCFRRWFRPSSGALGCVYSLWYNAPTMLPAGSLEAQ